MDEGLFFQYRLFTKAVQYFRRDDHSFSAFGQNDKHGSTWLTAFVIRSFKQAQPFIFVDDHILQKSIAFLNAQQQQVICLTFFL